MHLALAVLLYFLTGAVVYGIKYFLHQRKPFDPAAVDYSVFAESLPDNASIREYVEYHLIQFIAFFILLLIWPFVNAYFLWQKCWEVYSSANKNKYRPKKHD